MGNKALDVSNKKYGKLTALERVGKDKNGKTLWRCICECGNETVVPLNNLQKGNTKSCGCLLKEKTTQRNITHGKSKTRLYRIWSLMKNRCYCPTTPHYYNYGGRGITVCDEWLNSFEAFCEWAMSNGYADDLTIDRVNVNGNYEPSNCRWATAKQQANNRRTNHIVELNGQPYTVTECAKIMGCSRRTVSRGNFSGQKIKI